MQMRNVIWQQSENFQRVTWLFSSRGHNETPGGQINKIGVAAMAIDIEKTWAKTLQRSCKGRKVQDCVKWGWWVYTTLTWHLYICGSLFNLVSLSAFLFTMFKTSLTFNVLIPCLGSFPLQDIFKSKLHSTLLTTENQWQASVMGPCKGVEGPFIKFAHRYSFTSSCQAFYIFSCAIFCTVPQLTERLEEANRHETEVLKLQMRGSCKA